MAHCAIGDYHVDVQSRRGLRPFLKWVGGKRQLLPVLRRFYPAGIARYFEPFLGSGAVYFDLLNQGAIDRQAAFLSDDNADLIGCYRRIADSRDAVIDALERLAQGHAARGRAHYLDIRDRVFNPARAAWRDDGEDLSRYTPQLAAAVIYLNRTGYNGLFRQNAAGEYNVPPGRYDNPKIVDRALLTMASAALSRSDVVLTRASFDVVLGHAQAGDFVYVDPPYAPLSTTANFRGYTGRGFGDQQQQRLQQVVIALATRGVHVLLSNSTAPEVVRLYDGNGDAVAAGLAAYYFPARRAVNSRADRRGAIPELIVSNVRPGPAGTDAAGVS